LLVSLTISPVKNREGKIVDASKILRDITERSAKGAKGIAREMLARIWDLFVQAELQSYRSRRIGDRADGGAKPGVAARRQCGSARVLRWPRGTDVMADFRPEVAFLDVGMPVMDGYELVRRMRHDVREQALLVAVTGYGMAEGRRSSQEARFDEHVVKPAAPAAPGTAGQERMSPPKNPRD
jgi:CheY-like chemotaxis protein